MLLVPWRYPDLPKPAFLLAGSLTTTAAVVALSQARCGRWIRALHLALAGTAALYLAWFGHYTPPLNEYHSGRPFFQEAAALAGTETVMMFEVPISTAVFYMDRTPWLYGKESRLQQAITDSTGALIMTRPHIAERFEGLEKILVREFKEPFGHSRAFGLYRAPDKGVNRPD